ncbi:hypothetical protein [Mucilaginibacter sp.]|uniref:hypothetical protein n=1 Tax=Mucilaginibacter sp. TaxID=1882438 RepID=UPI00374CD7CC
MNSAHTYAAFVPMPVKPVPQNARNMGKWEWSIVKLVPRLAQNVPENVKKWQLPPKNNFGFLDDPVQETAFIKK